MRDAAQHEGVSSDALTPILDRMPADVWFVRTSGNEEVRVGSLDRRWIVSAVLSAQHDSERSGTHTVDLRAVNEAIAHLIESVSEINRTIESMQSRESIGDRFGEHEPAESPVATRRRIQQRIVNILSKHPTSGNAFLSDEICSYLWNEEGL